jgi:hypothetical protein
MRRLADQGRTMNKKNKAEVAHPPVVGQVLVEHDPMAIGSGKDDE